MHKMIGYYANLFSIHCRLAYKKISQSPVLSGVFTIKPHMLSLAYWRLNHPEKRQIWSFQF